MRIPQDPDTATGTHSHGRGDTIVLEGMIGRRTGLVLPATVVDTTGGDLVCFVADGTPMLRLLPSPGSSLPRVLSPSEIEADTLRLVPQVWTGTHVLSIVPRDARYAIRARWQTDWTFLGWYVNVQTVTEVQADRWITEDQFLDIVVQPDRAWAWKDEDELAEAVRIGRLPADEAALLTAVGESLILRIERAEWPFSPAIASWR
ncbi:MAG: DUF402 domain-containing protein, partial [Thermomicrobiales bacterium]